MRFSEGKLFNENGFNNGICAELSSGRSKIGSSDDGRLAAAKNMPTRRKWRLTTIMCSPYYVFFVRNDFMKKYNTKRLSWANLLFKTTINSGKIWPLRHSVVRSRR